MSATGCTCGWNGWFSSPCDACRLQAARDTIAASERPRSETEVERLRRENAALRDELKSHQRCTSYVGSPGVCSGSRQYRQCVLKTHPGGDHVYEREHT